MKNFGSPLTILGASCQAVPLLWAWSTTEHHRVRIVWHCLRRGQLRSRETKTLAPSSPLPFLRPCLSEFHELPAIYSIMSLSTDPCIHWSEPTRSRHILKVLFFEHCTVYHLYRKRVRRLFHIQVIMSNVRALSGVSVLGRKIFYVFLSVNERVSVDVKCSF